MKKKKYKNKIIMHTPVNQNAGTSTPDGGTLSAMFLQTEPDGVVLSAAEATSARLSGSAVWHLRTARQPAL
jgi:hypothetical protein